MELQLENIIKLFGNSIDMIIDRLSTASILYILGSFYSSYFIIFLLLILLDIGSHWLQVYSYLLLIGENKSNSSKLTHKDLNEDFDILNLYYTNSLVLDICVLGSEIFLLLLYQSYFFEIDNILYKVFYYMSFGIYVFKQVLSSLQIISASRRIVRIDESKKNC